MCKEIDIRYMPEKTEKVFKTLSELSFIKKYSLVGGTALSIQIGHRISEDLDFIYDSEKLNTQTIKRYISKHFPNYKIIRQDYDWQIDFVINDVKVTFFSAGAVQVPLKVIPHTIMYNNLNICRFNIIASLKMATIAQLNTITDYFDLYILSKYHMPLVDIISQTKKLFPNLSAITYTETLVYTDDIEEQTIENHLSPSEPATKQQISSYFTQELRKIKHLI